MRPPSMYPASPLFKINGFPSSTSFSPSFLKNCTDIFPSMTTVMSSPGCECGGSELPRSHISIITSTPFSSVGTVPRMVNPAGVSGTTLWCFQTPEVADVDIVLIEGFDASMNRLQAARSMCVTDRIDIVTWMFVSSKFI